MKTQEWKAAQFVELQKTKSFLDARNSQYGAFVHKWSGEIREYKRSELYPPNEFYSCGHFIINPASKTVSVGGTRAPTVKTFRYVSSVAKLLAQAGAVVVSGGVPGVDLAAHLGALDGVENSICTYAVLANPVNDMLSGHIWGSKVLSSLIVQHGAFVSEYKDNIDVSSPCFRERLLQRDRIISAISGIFLAFECSENSATVDTAKRAKLQGKAVFAIEPEETTHRRGVYQLVDEGIAKHIPASMTPNYLAGLILDNLYIK